MLKNKKAADAAITKYYTDKRVTRAEYETIQRHRDQLKQALERVDFALESMTEPCCGEAHTNAHIDNCMVCAPQWGVVLRAECTASE